MNSGRLINLAKRNYWALRGDPLYHLKYASRLTRLGVEAVQYAVRGRASFGLCPICEGRTVFVRRELWNLREGYLCIRCRSNPRFRALVLVLRRLFPNYRDLQIHESSPWGAASDKLRRECKSYSASHFFIDTAVGTYRNGIRCENLEKMSFANDSFDLFVTQDVLEHVMNPAAAFAEIARVLKPGGTHVFTVPYYGTRKTRVRAMAQGGEIVYLAEKDYHGNPIDSSGSLVVTEWGYDLPEFVLAHGGLATTRHSMNDARFGIEGEPIEIFVSRKSNG